MVKINGTDEEINDLTVEEYLSGTNYSRTRIAVEINGEIVPKSRYADTVLKDGDVVEIVGFVGGG